MKPGPAISTLSICGSARSLSAMAVASSRGFLPASLASTIAALVAISPCEASRGGSTTMRERSVPSGSTDAAASRTLVSISANKCGCGADGVTASMTAVAAARTVSTTLLRSDGVAGAAVVGAGLLADFVARFAAGLGAALLTGLVADLMTALVTGL